RPGRLGALRAEEPRPGPGRRALLLREPDGAAARRPAARGVSPAAYGRRLGGDGRRLRDGPPPPVRRRRRPGGLGGAPESAAIARLRAHARGRAPLPIAGRPSPD